MIILGISGPVGSGKNTVADLLIEQFEQDGIKARRISFASKLKDVCCLMFGWDRERLESDPLYKEGGLGGWVPRDNPGEVPMSKEELLLSLSDGHFPSDCADPDLTPKELEQADQEIRDRLWKENQIRYVELDTDEACVALGLTRRQLMQMIGTEGMREQVNPDFWVILVRLAMSRGEYTDLDVGIISDARFSNELNFIKETGFTMQVRRTSNTSLTPYTTHQSEREWQAWGAQHGWDIRIDNCGDGLMKLRDDIVTKVYSYLEKNFLYSFAMPQQAAILARTMEV